MAGIPVPEDGGGVFLRVRPCCWDTCGGGARLFLKCILDDDVVELDEEEEDDDGTTGMDIGTAAG